MVFSDLIKLLEIEYQIVSQEVKGSKVDAVLHRNQNQTLDNVCINYLQHNPQQYIGDYLYIQARQSDVNMIFFLSEVVVDILKRFREATSVAPQHMVLYFSGISEGQFSLVSSVTETYMKAIHTGISSLSTNYKPHITALAVSKDHNERIYKSKISGTRASEQNIPPGTVVDTKIVSPVINEFYLNAHSAFQGTAKTPKYSLLADDSKVPLDIVERMTHGLCFLHEIVTSTVSVPVPLIVADRCAKRGHNVFIANS
ncbi:unnamed protein product [Nippostrongylus brasiliensis]|uniref:Piwi domain-containing protein n=1 Tax=Nippostrongylus brasiliensis TaxID=27835 RepID=A0A0N4XLE5_NIPBR|nr:unnamed protein product [Nippostrongylus brasiliensis]